MSRLPTLPALEVVRAFQPLGWHEARRSGSHIIMVKEGHIATLWVPNHRQVARGTLRSLIRSAGLTVKEFQSALSRASG